MFVLKWAEVIDSYLLNFDSLKAVSVSWKGRQFFTELFDPLAWNLYLLTYMRVFCLGFVIGLLQDEVAQTPNPYVILNL